MAANQVRSNKERKIPPSIFFLGRGYFFVKKQQKTKQLTLKLKINIDIFKKKPKLKTNALIFISK